MHLPSSFIRPHLVFAASLRLKLIVSTVSIRENTVCAIGETECNELEVFILGGQRIDKKRKKGWQRGRRERIEKGSRERIEIERRETKGN